ncbi:MAG TPA: UvrD-helicase domain-containing protein [Burkholderiales bacterium]|nr:UvrD-helicase domain-containing protein [Burkholderiales bacterium]
MSEPIADQAQRDAALDVRRSFIVQAPAGSGKTELLVRRFLNLLSSVEKPEEILAITFTRKAAAEMRKRVLQKLPELGMAAGDVAHRLRIQTIDALCVSLTRNMPVLARFGAQPGIVEDAWELYFEAASRTLRELTPPVERLLAHLDNDVGFATRLVANMLSQRDRWLRRTGQAPTRAELEAALVSERRRLEGRAKALYPDSSQELARLFLTKDLEWRKKPPAPPQAVAIPGLLEALQALYHAPPAEYSAERWQALEAILALLNPAVAQLKVVFAERNECDFTEFSHGALRALGGADDPSDLLLQLDQRISHILVDEFQDTSTSQWQLLEMLTAGWQPGDGRTLFLVGDPMQSIYRFREAEVSLFLQAKHAGLGAVALDPLTLRTNFRSQANLVSWFNESFARVLPAEEDEASGAIPYSPAAPKHPPLDGPAAQWHGFYDRVLEAQKVVDLVRQSSGSKAILVRNRAHLDEIVPALKDAGLRFKAVEIEQLGEKQVVQDLFALTRALTHLGDRVAALAVLRAPWCGLSLSDLHLLAGVDSVEEGAGSRPRAGGGPVSFLISDLLRDVSHLSEDAQLRISRTLAVLDPLWRNRQRGSLRDAVEGAWLALGGPACVADATELEDAEIFLDELERLEDAGAVDLAKLAERMQKLYALPDVEAPADAVEIMTIHKAKGLEFDTVIVPGLDRIPRAGPRPLFAWKTIAGGGGVSHPRDPLRHPREGGDPVPSLLLAPIDSPGGEGDEIYKYIRSLDRDADDIESGRLFYVAATRARQRLHLLACTKCDDDNAPKEPFKRSLLHKIWWQAAPHFGPAPADVEEEERQPLPDFLRRLPADFKVPGAPLPTTWIPPAQGREEAQIEFSWAGETARHVGTIVHRWLQRIADDQLQNWNPARVDALKARFSAELRRRGVTSTEARASSELIHVALLNTLTDERGRWLLSAHPEARSELRLRVHSEHGARHFIMDRVFRDDAGIWLVDFKTSRHEGADVEAFLDRERDRYTPQLSAYGKLIPGSRQALYFPMLKGWREAAP